MLKATLKKIKAWLGRRGQGKLSFSDLFEHFQKLIVQNNRSLEIMADLGEKLSGEYVFDQHYIQVSAMRLADSVYKLIYHLDCMAPGKYAQLFSVYNKIRAAIEQELRGKVVIPVGPYVVPYGKIEEGLEDVVGGKNARLAVARNVLGLEIPPGFAITSHSFRSFLRQGALGEQLATLAAQWERNEIDSQQYSVQARSLIMETGLPKGVAQSILQAIGGLRRELAQENVYFALRSSALSEDSEHSFAGQYASFLNVAERDVLQTYKKVIASAFGERALEYRREKGFRESEVVMAVACQVLIQAKVSGVVYTLDAFKLEENRMLIAALPGYGEAVVSGKRDADRFFVSRMPPNEVLGMDIVHKESKLDVADIGGLEYLPLDPDFSDRPCLTQEQVQEVATASLRLEKYFKHPQDIEFAFDHQGQLVILQSRPLNLEKSRPKLVCDLSSLEKKFPVLLANQGDIVQEGVAMGEVYKVSAEQDLNFVPEGAILVAHFSSPSLARVIKKVSGIITDIGSPIGHMATIAREFRVPMLINTKKATQLLHQGQEVTLDAIENVVYAGLMHELCFYEFIEEKFEESYEYRLLKRIYKKISPLNLVDPNQKEFSPSACKTMHDVIRYVHEQAVKELIEQNYFQDSSLTNSASKLKLNIPLDLVVIDISKEEVSRRKVVDLARVSSRPLRKFVKGMSVPGLWARDPVAVDFKSFMSSMTKTFSSEVADPRFVGQNLAVVSQEYANISLRLGYHFSMVDTFATKNERDNYIYFRFFGGVTDKQRRSRRARLIGNLLSENDFLINRKGDLVVARLKGLSQEDTLEKIFILGVLVAYTRQLDVQMVDEQRISYFANQFHRLLLEHIGDGSG